MCYFVNDPKEYTNFINEKKDKLDLNLSRYGHG